MTDHDSPFYRQYAEARVLLPATERTWMEAAARRIPVREGMRILDLGSGTGRFSAALAEAFHAEVLGVEPSDQMRGNAVKGKPHPLVEYVAGTAEAIPAGNGVFDAAWMSMVIHHVRDLDACGSELSRVLKPGAVLLVRNSFRGRLAGIPFYRWFPAALAKDEERLPAIETVKSAFGSRGLAFRSLDVVKQVLVESIRAYAGRIAKGGLSSLEVITPGQREAGLRVLDAAAREEKEPAPLFEDIDMLVFTKEGGPA
jgi:ubiquinone/menaquinone biosynthesis C-methylase UbiE